MYNGVPEDKTIRKKMESLQYIVGEKLQQMEGLLWVLEQDDDKGAGARLLEEQQAEPEKLMNKYALVFCEQKGLPPLRGRTHAIILQPNAEAVSVRPYRCPQYQKDKIERQVKGCWNRE